MTKKYRLNPPTENKLWRISKFYWEISNVSFMTDKTVFANDVIDIHRHMANISQHQSRTFCKYKHAKIRTVEAFLWGAEFGTNMDFSDNLTWPIVTRVAYNIFRVIEFTNNLIGRIEVMRINNSIVTRAWPMLDYPVKVGEYPISLKSRILDFLRSSASYPGYLGFPSIGAPYVKLTYGYCFTCHKLMDLCRHKKRDCRKNVIQGVLDQ
jgi:hypothetical protein